MIKQDKIVIPIRFYTDDDGNRQYDDEGMSEEFQWCLGKLNWDLGKGGGAIWRGAERNKIATKK